MRTPQRAALAAMAIITLLAGVFIGAPAAAADELGSGVLSLSKTVEVTAAQEPGATFVYSIGFGCSSTTTGCVDAVLTDSIPAPLEIVGTPLVVGVGSYDISVTGNDVVVEFTDSVSNTDPPSTGLADSTTGTMQVTVQVPTGLAKSWDAQTVTNTAIIDAVNADQKQSSVDVPLSVPTDIAVTTTKVWTPATAPYTPAEASTVVLSAANASNISASSIVVDEPAAPINSLDNVFAFYDLTATPSVTFPEGADLVQVDTLVGGTWLMGTSAATASLPAAVNPVDVEALRVTFTSSTGASLTARGSAGTISLALAQRELNRGNTSLSLSSGGTRLNTVSAQVQTPEGNASAPATDDQVIAPLTAQVTVGKTFDTAQIPAGDSTTARITATNTSTGPLDALVISDPVAPSTFFSADVRFAGFDVSAATWPAGAASATITWSVNGGTVPAPQTITQISDLPTSAPGVSAGMHITGFEIAFSGEIEVGAEAKFGVKVETTEAAAALPMEATAHNNRVRATGTNAAGSVTADAPADLLVWTRAVKVALDKTIRPTDVYAGGYSLVELLASTPPGVVTVQPHSIVISEPETPGSSEYWNAFNPVSIAPTAVPLGSVLTIDYFDSISGDWESMAGSLGVVDATVAAQLFSANLTSLLPGGVAVSQVAGLRFTFTDADGFGRNTSVKPAIMFQARDTLRDTGTPTSFGVPSDDATWATYQNTALAEVSDGETVPLTDSAVDSANARLIPTESGTGPAPGIAGKIWDDLTLQAQSRAETGVTLTWGAQTGGITSASVSDVANPTVAGIPGTVFQAFNLRRIDAITTTSDPLIRWDEVTKVELYSAVGEAWVDVTNKACTTATACVGTFPGYTLEPTEISDTIGVQLTFAERADRAAAIIAAADPMAPPVGSGVASAPAGGYSGASTQGRTIHLDLTLRSKLRVPTTQDYVTATETYNHAAEGVVRNAMTTVLTPAVGTDITAGAHADITLMQTPPTVEATKTVTPTTNLTIPRPDVLQGAYPTATYRTTVTNTSVTNVSAMRLTDPSVCTDPLDPATCGLAIGDVPFSGVTEMSPNNPFDRFNLTTITISLSAGAGVTDQEVHLWKRDNYGTLTVEALSASVAQGLTEAQLVDVIGLSVLFTGEDAEGATIVSGAQATVDLGVRLRATVRSTGAAPTPSVVQNVVLVGVHDEVLYPILFNQDAKAASSTLADGYVEVATAKAVTPNSALIASAASPVQVDLRARSTGTVSPKQLTITDSAATFWNAFTLLSASVPSMPSGADRVELQALVGSVWQSDGPTTQALAALPAAVDPADVTGVRAIYTRADGALFVGTNNAVNLSLQVELRTQLRDGSGPVTADEVTTPMPGETAPGRVSNTVLATITHDELSDDATANAAFDIRMGSASMAVEKTSVGQSAAGKDVPFTLRVRNTGTGNLVNPVVVDQLPADGSLLYVPTDVPNFSSTAGGTLSTNPTDVTRTYDSATNRITFTWPAGATLAPGETYSITLRLQLQPGMTAGTIALNALQATNDRQVTGCAAINPGNGRTVTLTDNTCATDNVVTILSIGSFSASKGVRSAQGGATNTVNSAVTCNSDADGYYRYPCAADTRIGDQDEWRLRLVNGGTIGATTLQFIDVFPHFGDRGVVDPSPRGSGYTPTFLGDVAFASSASGVDFEWFYTTVTTVCTDDIFPGPPNCAPGDWQPSSTLTPATTPSVSAIKVVFDFSALPGGALPPASELDVTYSTLNEPSATASDGRAPVTVPVADVRAWNSFGYYPTYVSGANPPSPEEPIKAGVRLSSGSLAVEKTVVGSESGRAPTSFTATATCTIAGAPVVMGLYGAIDLDQANSYTARIDGLPNGAECTVAEDGITGWFGESTRTGPQIVTVVPLTPLDLVGVAQTVGLVNTYEPKVLAFTGAQLVEAIALGGFALIGSGLLLLVWRRRSSRHLANR